MGRSCDWDAEPRLPLWVKRARCGVGEQACGVASAHPCPQVSEFPGERAGPSVEESELGSKHLASWDELPFHSGQ